MKISKSDFLNLIFNVYNAILNKTEVGTVIEANLCKGW